MYADRAAVHWFTASVGGGLFPCPRAHPYRPSTKRAPPGFIPPRCVPPLQSSFAPTSARALSGRARCLGFGRLRDITRGRPHPARRPTSLRSVLRLSQPLDGLLRSLAPGLVSSPSRVHGSSTRSGASRSAQCLRPRRTALPPCRSTSAGSSSLAARRPPAEASTSRPLSARSSVRTGSVMSLADGRSPPRVRLLQVPCASDGSAASPRSSAHGVHLRQPSLARSPTTIASSVSPPRTGCVCLQTYRPAREFRA